MHARTSTRRHHGFGRGRLRSLLHIRSPFERVSACRCCIVTTTTANKIDKSTESFRDKVMRKCGESIEMKEKFFIKYADQIEELSKEMAKRFADGRKLLTMEMVAACAMPSLHRRIHAPDNRKTRSFSRHLAGKRYCDDDGSGQRHRFFARVRQSIALARPAGRHGAGGKHQWQVAKPHLCARRSAQKTNAYDRVGRKGWGTFPRDRRLLFRRPVL